MTWEQPGTELDILISGGEGPKTEFKREIPSDKKKLLKTIAAFATGDGGTLLIGVDDDGQITGFPKPADTVDALTRRVHEMIRNALEPQPSFTTRMVEQRGKRVMLVEAAPGYQSYVLRKEPGLEFYVRRGASTMPARHDEIAAGFRR